MSQFNNLIDKILPHIIVLLISTLFLLVSIEANELQKQISGSSGFLNFLYSTNNFVAFLIPILAYAFFIITTKFMFLIFDVEPSEISVHYIVSYSFIPLLIFMLFYLANLIFFQKEMIIESIEDVQRIEFIFNLKFEDFKIISLIGWLMVYVLLIIQLIKNMKISIGNSILIALLPSIIDLILKYTFELI